MSKIPSFLSTTRNQESDAGKRIVFATQERGVVALLTVAFLAFIGALAVAFVLASARINNAYSLLNGAAQSAAFSAVTSAEVEDSNPGNQGAAARAVIPCNNPQTVRQTEASGCASGDSYEAARELLDSVFADKPSGFCFSSCEANDTRVHLGEANSSWIQVFNTEDNPLECSSNDFLANIDGVLASAAPPRFRCWVVREDQSDPPYSIRYSSGVVVRLTAQIDLFFFADREIEVFAGATISQGE